jgi:hypothetical protein
MSIADLKAHLSDVRGIETQNKSRHFDGGQDPFRSNPINGYRSDRPGMSGLVPHSDVGSDDRAAVSSQTIVKIPFSKSIVSSDRDSECAQL